MLSQNLNFSLNICSEIKPSLQLEKKGRNRTHKGRKIILKEHEDAVKVQLISETILLGFKFPKKQTKFEEFLP